ncbi:MAG: hypothetical protein VB087_07885 [Candidatus Limiplasma sp.]|nr:hypothetical protein [Candidatus Limiplasma sp.]
MQINRDTLMELRRLRLDAQYHNAKAAEYMARATHGTSTRRATDMSGTGKCPLTTSAEAYGREHAAAAASTKAANAIWAQVMPLLDGVRLDERLVIEYLYNKGMDYPDIAKSIKRNIDACYRMHGETLRAMARAQT